LDNKILELAKILPRKQLSQLERVISQTPVDKGRNQHKGVNNPVARGRILIKEEVHRHPDSTIHQREPLQQMELQRINILLRI
jgi:hypothetical protein